MPLWHLLVACWLALFTGQPGSTCSSETQIPTERPGLRAWALRRLPALGMVPLSLALGILALSSWDPSVFDDLVFLWMAIGTVAAGVVPGIWYWFNPWITVAD